MRKSRRAGISRDWMDKTVDHALRIDLESPFSSKWTPSLGFEKGDDVAKMGWMELDVWGIRDYPALEMTSVVSTEPDAVFNSRFSTKKKVKGHLAEAKPQNNKISLWKHSQYQHSSSSEEEGAVRSWVTEDWKNCHKSSTMPGGCPERKEGFLE